MIPAWKAGAIDHYATPAYEIIEKIKSENELVWILYELSHLFVAIATYLISVHRFAVTNLPF